MAQKYKTMRKHGIKPCRMCGKPAQHVVMHGGRPEFLCDEHEQMKEYQCQIDYKAFNGFLIRAPSQKEARRMAKDYAERNIKKYIKVASVMEVKR